MIPNIFKLEKIEPMPQIPDLLPPCATSSVPRITVCPCLRVFVLLDVHLQLRRTDPMYF